MKENNQYNYCNVIGDTHVGCKRKVNEDSFDHFECKNGLVSVVCDGMGGHVGGAKASSLAVETIKELLNNKYFNDPKEAIIEACNEANLVILQYASQHTELSGMGSTCVILIVRDGQVFIGSIGDSRAYLIRSKKIKQLTTDQSYVQLLVDEGVITKEQAEHHPRKNEITNALGLTSMQPATVLSDPINPEAGDCFLLCSDGLSGMVSDKEILKVVGNQTGMTQRERVQELIKRACTNGGLDNITSLIVEFAITPKKKKDCFLRKKHSIIFLCLALIVLCIGGYFIQNHYQKNSNNQKQTNIKPKSNNKNNSIPYNDTIIYKPNTIILEIELHNEFNGIYLILANKDTIPIKRGNIAMDNITITPSENFIRSEHGRKLRFKSNKQPFNSKYITIELKNGNDIISYTIPVKIAPQFINNDNADTDSNKGKKVSKDLQEILDNISSNQKEKEFKEVITGTIKIGKQGTTKVTLISSLGKANNDTLYSSYGIKAGEKKDTWYSYNCKNGNICNIEIDNKKTPTNAIIEIPLANTDKKFTIFVTK